MLSSMIMRVMGIVQANHQMFRCVLTSRLSMHILEGILVQNQYFYMVRVVGGNSMNINLVGSVPTLHLSEVLSKRIIPYSSILYSEVSPSIELTTFFPDDVISLDDDDDIELYRNQSRNIQHIMNDLIENLQSSSTEGILDVDYSPLLSLSPEVSDSDSDDDIIDDDHCPLHQIFSGFDELGGIILHSAMLSGGKIAFHCNLFRCCDPFDNSVNASRVKVIIYYVFLVVSCISHPWSKR